MLMLQFSIADSYRGDSGCYGRVEWSIVVSWTSEGGDRNSGGIHPARRCLHVTRWRDEEL